LKMRLRIRDFFINKDGWIFAVVGYEDRDYINGMLRYIPDEHGERERDGERYRKLEFNGAIEFIRENKPEYLSKEALLISKRDIKEILKPEKELKNAMRRSRDLKKLVCILSEAGVSKEAMGITGSRLLNLETDSSDIDFVIYGEEWQRAREIIKNLKRGKIIRDLDEDTWKKIYEKRRPELSFEEFLTHEKRKGNRGMIGERYFDLLYVRDWKEIEEINFPTKKEKIGVKKIRATVSNAKYAFDSPAIYEVRGDVDTVVSFTHTYTGQCFEGEVIEAKGVLEKWDEKEVLVVGTTREAKGEYIKSLSLLGEL